MRPTKNRYFCPDCREFKMSFETEMKAYRFIEYESVNILEENGYCPIRAYKCPVCGCWHLTSEFLDEDGICECIVEKEELESTRSLLGLVVRNTHTIALNLDRKIKTFSRMLDEEIVDWDRAKNLAEEILVIFETTWRTPYRHVYHVRKQRKKYQDLLILYNWRKNLNSVA